MDPAQGLEFRLVRGLEAYGQAVDPQRVIEGQGLLRSRRGICFHRKLGVRPDMEVLVYRPNDLFHQLLFEPGRGPAPDVDGRDVTVVHPLGLVEKFPQKGLRIAATDITSIGPRREVAVEALLHAEGDVDVDFRLRTFFLCRFIHYSCHSSSSFRTLMKASWGIWTLPNWRIRFLPSFCFSRSFFFRVMSPP